MLDDSTPSFRKTKRDKKAKANYNKYKKGGSHRSSNIKIKTIPRQD